MKHNATLVSAWCLLSSLAMPSFASAQAQTQVDPLTATITALDTQVFEAYNRCDLATFGSLFTPNVEFYHDTGGATFDRRTVIANTRKYICNKVRRELIQGSLKVYPIKNYGAIAEGEHRFCEVSAGACEGIAKFVIVWRQTGETWQITRVLSYGHRALVPNGQQPNSR